MTFLATTTCAVYRGETESPLGDDVPNNAVPVAGMTALPLGLVERDKRVQDPATGLWRTVRYSVGRLTPGTDVRMGDRIKDNTTGKFYAVDDIKVTPRSISGGAGLTLELRNTR